MDDLIGDLLGHLVGGLIERFRKSASRRRAHRGLSSGKPISETLLDVWLRQPDAPRPREWRRGELRITPSSVYWRTEFLRKRVDLGEAEFIRSRRPADLAIDWRLDPAMRVLAFRVGGQSIELGARPAALDDLLYRLYGADAPAHPTVLSSPDVS